MEYLPGTFEETKPYKAKVNYKIKATIVAKDQKTPKMEKEMEIVLSFKDSNLQKSIHQKVQANMNTPINVRYALKIKLTKLKRTMGK